MNKKNTALYRNTPQVGFLSIFYASMDHPLNIWEKQIRGGYIRRLFDEDRVPALQILAPSVLSTFITAPCSPYSTLGIRLNYLVVVMRKVARMFTFEVQIQDDTHLRRRFRFCNFQITVRRNIACCYMPLLLQEGWNEIVVDLGEFTKKAYGTNYVECVRIKIYPNCRLRQVYFTASPISCERVLNIMRTSLKTPPERIPGSCVDLDETLFRKHSSQMSNISTNSTKRNRSKTVSAKTSSSGKVKSTTTVNVPTECVEEMIEDLEVDEIGQHEGEETITESEEVENEEVGQIVPEANEVLAHMVNMLAESEGIENEETDELAEHEDSNVVDTETILNEEETQTDEIMDGSKFLNGEETISELEVGRNEELPGEIIEQTESPTDEKIITESQGNEDERMDDMAGHSKTQVENETVKESQEIQNGQPDKITGQADKIIGQTETLEPLSDVVDLDFEFTPVNEREFK